MSSSKVLVVSNSPHMNIGGSQLYNKILFECFPEIHFFEYPILWPKEKSINSPASNVEIIDTLKSYENYYESFWVLPAFLKSINLPLLKRIINFINVKLLQKRIAKELNDLIRVNNIGKIILANTYFFNKKFIKKNINKIIFIQHATPYTYLKFFKFSGSENKFIKTTILDKILFWKHTHKNNFIKHCGNIVTFNCENTKIFAHYYDRKYYEIDIPSIFEIYDSSVQLKDRDFILPSRLNKLKNIKGVLNLSEKMPNKKFVFFGQSEDVDISSNKNMEVHDSVSTDSLWSEYIHAKFMLSLSYTEGSPFTISEAFSLGVPCIVADTYPSAKYLIGIDNGENNRGLLVNLDDPLWKEKIVDFVESCEYSKLCANCIAFAQQNLTIEMFRRKWLELLSK